MGDPHNTSTTRYSAYPACGRADVNPWTEPPFIRCPDHKIKQPQQWRIFATVSTITAIASAIATRSNRQHHGSVYAIFFLYVSIDRWPMTISFLVVFFALFHLIFFLFLLFHSIPSQYISLNTLAVPRYELNKDHDCSSSYYILVWMQTIRRCTIEWQRRKKGNK